MKKLIIIFVLILFTGCNDEEIKLEANKVNLNNAVIEQKVIDDFIITDISVIYDSGLTTFKAVVKNNGNTKKINKVNVSFKTKNNTEITTLVGYINKELNNGDETNILITSDVDLTNAYNIEFKFE